MLEKNPRSDQPRPPSKSPRKSRRKGGGTRQPRSVRNCKPCTLAYDSLPTLPTFAATNETTKWRRCVLIPPRPPKGKNWQMQLIPIDAYKKRVGLGMFEDVRIGHYASRVVQGSTRIRSSNDIKAELMKYLHSLAGGDRTALAEFEEIKEVVASAGADGGNGNGNGTARPAAGSPKGAAIAEVVEVADPSIPLAMVDTLNPLFPTSVSERDGVGV